MYPIRKMACHRRRRSIVLDSPELVGTGRSAITTTLDNMTLLKGHQAWWEGQAIATTNQPVDEGEDRILRENFVYERLGQHDNILKNHGLEEIHPGIHSLRLEIAPEETVAHYISKCPGITNGPPTDNRLRMCFDVAKGLKHMHSRGVFHLDLTTRDLYLFERYRVKIGDFDTAIIPDHEDYSTNEDSKPRYLLPSLPPGVERTPAMCDIIALGYVMYGITVWQEPHQSYMSLWYKDEMFPEGEFPNVETNVIGDIIEGCWKEKFTSVDEVIEVLEPRVWKAEREWYTMPASIGTLLSV